MNHRFIAAFGSGASYMVGTSLNHQACRSESKVRLSALCAILPFKGGLMHTHSFLADQVPELTDGRIQVVPVPSDISELSLTNVISSSVIVKDRS
jgi:hypothetical protein